MRGIGYFFKLKFYLGTQTALRVFWDKCIIKRRIKVPFINYPFKIRYNDFADDQIFNEVILKRSYQGLSQKHTVNRILDLGSNIGLSAISFLSEYPNAEIAVMEPDQDNYKMLQENTKSYNESKKRVHYFNAAVYNRETELFIDNPNVGSHGFRMAETRGRDDKASVQAVTINNLLTQLGWDQVDIIKVDIEGAEKELFSSNTEWIGRARYLIVETHDRFKPDCTKTVFKALENYAYQMKVWNQNMLFSLRQDQKKLH